MRNITLHDYIGRVVGKSLEYTDCDGCTRAVAYLLSLADIKFKIFVGKIRAKDNLSYTIPIHYWIEDDNNDIWDYKSYKWLKKEPEDCIYMKKQDVTKTFKYDAKLFKILVEFGPIIGKKMDIFYEKTSGKKFHRK